MAYDKVVDSAVLDAGLKAVADAIREKGGTTDSLAFHAGMVQAIAAIEAGGGVQKASGTFVVESDTKDTQMIFHNLGVVPNVLLIFPEKPIIQSSLKQFGFVVVVSFDVENAQKTFGSMSYLRANETTFYKNEYFCPTYSYEEYTLIGNKSSTGVPIYLLTENQFKLGANLHPQTISNAYFIAGVKYHWVVASVDFGAVGEIIDDVGGIAVL